MSLFYIVESKEKEICNKTRKVRPILNVLELKASNNKTTYSQIYIGIEWRVLSNCMERVAAASISPNPSSQ